MSNSKISSDSSNWTKSKDSPPPAGIRVHNNPPLSTRLVRKFAHELLLVSNKTEKAIINEAMSSLKDGS